MYFRKKISYIYAILIDYGADEETAECFCLLHLERLFRSPFHDEDSSMAPFQCVYIYIYIITGAG
jgi:hypothetical protein